MADASRTAAIYSELHANIQDKFNETGVEAVALQCRVVPRTFFGWNSESGGTRVELALNRAARGGIGEAELDLFAAPCDHAVRDSPVAMQ